MRNPQASKIADALSRDVHYTVDEKQKSVLLTEDGYEAVEEVLQVGGWVLACVCIKEGEKGLGGVLLTVDVCRKGHVRRPADGGRLRRQRTIGCS